MEWAIAFGALCAIGDCAKQKINQWILLGGFLAGILITARRLLQGELHWYEIFFAVLPGILLWLCSKGTGGKLGTGDGDMVIVLGLFLGWRLCLTMLCLACLLAAVFAGIGLAAGRLKRNSRIPFAPFLLVAVIAAGALSLGGAGIK